jgi:alkylated DNA repair dioxygenase AlkB
MQPSLFPLETTFPLLEIHGLCYIPNFITTAEEQALLQAIDAQPWLTDLKRRVQHYGWKYDYTARRVDETMRLGSLPDWLMVLCQKLERHGYFSKPPDQVIINEYQPGQGISPHIDCVPCFEETIASLSLGSPCVMDFIHADTGVKSLRLLEPRSLLLFSGDARYHWKHSIAARKSDKHNGQIIPRSRRVSLTFRNVVLAETHLF